MKRFNYTILAAAALLALASCTEKAAPYEAGPQPTGAQVFFPVSTATVYTVGVENKLTVQLARVNADDAATVNVAISNVGSGTFSAPASVSFAASEKTADLAITYSYDSLPLIDTLTVTLSGEDIAAYGVTEESFIINKAWKDLGTGKLFDQLALMPGSDDPSYPGIIDVQVLQAPDGSNRWRIIDPFPEDQLIAAWGEEYLGEVKDDVIEFYVTDESAGTVKWDKDVYTGLYYPGYGNIVWYYRYPEECLFVTDNIVQFNYYGRIAGTNSGFGKISAYLGFPGVDLAGALGF